MPGPPGNNGKDGLPGHAGERGPPVSNGNKIIRSFLNILI